MREVSEQCQEVSKAIRGGGKRRGGGTDTPYLPDGENLTVLTGAVCA